MENMINKIADLGIDELHAMGGITDLQKMSILARWLGDKPWQADKHEKDLLTQTGWVSAT